MLQSQSLDRAGGILELPLHSTYRYFYYWYTEWVFYCLFTLAFEHKVFNATCVDDVGEFAGCIVIFVEA